MGKLAKIFSLRANGGAAVNITGVLRPACEADDVSSLHLIASIVRLVLVIHYRWPGLPPLHTFYYDQLRCDQNPG